MDGKQSSSSRPIRRARAALADNSCCGRPSVQEAADVGLSMIILALTRRPRVSVNVRGGEGGRGGEGRR